MPENQERNAKSGATPQLPPGVKLLRTLAGHKGLVRSVAFDPQGRALASGSDDKTVNLWEARSGKLLRPLEGHKGGVNSVAFDPQGGRLASGSDDKTVNLWEARSGRLLHTLEGHKGPVCSVAFDPQGRTLASSGSGGDNIVRLWEVDRGRLLHSLDGHQRYVTSMAFDPPGGMLASGSNDNTVKLWEVRSGKLLRTLDGYQDSVNCVVFDPQGGRLASGRSDKTVQIWEPRSGKLLCTLEGHTRVVDIVAFSSDGRLLASKSQDHTIRLWNCETWETVAVIPAPTRKTDWTPALAFHPTLPLLAAGSHDEIHLWELDFDVLLGQRSGASVPSKALHHTTAKIVLVGDSGVGKTGLGWRLAHGEFKEHASTHGQQFWVMQQLSTRRRDGTECEAILWDLAGQPDYRLIHALFLDDADLALVLFDPSDNRDPLHGVEFWLRQLRVGQASSLSVQPGRTVDRQDACPTLLVAARADRGTPTLTDAELQAFCQQRGLRGCVRTSAKASEGLEELIQRMKGLIPWEDKPAVTTEITFKRVKDFVLDLKEHADGKPVVVSWPELRQMLERHFAKLASAASVAQPVPAASSGSVSLPAQTPGGTPGKLAGEDARATLPPDWQFSDAEMKTAVGHLENYGYVRRLRTSKGEERVLLKPELLNNLAASFILEARRNPKGLGALEEKRLLDGGYRFPELEGLAKAEQDILVDAAALLFLERHVCFREQTLDGQAYLVFPELINLKMPLMEETEPLVEGVAYTVSGAVENVYASLVVLLGYTQTFTRTAQWKAQARYEVSGGAVCSFRQEAEREGELDFVLYFGAGVGSPERMLFQGLFECFLARRNLTVLRFEPVRCTNAECGHLLDRSVVRQRTREGKTFACCNDCGTRLELPKMAEPIQFARDVQAEVEAQRCVADQRTLFEQAVFRVQAYVKDQKLKVPECFISYAWGVAEHERWVKRLADDLAKAGIQIVYDRKDNQFGDSLTRFISRIPYCASVVVVGTPLYFQKFENRLSSTGSVVAAEVNLISQRLIGTPEEMRTVKTLLLAGEKKTSLPPLMWDLILADFRNEEAYFRTAFDLILSLYQLPPNYPSVADLRESLRGSEMR